MRLPAFVCLSVCLSARLLKNACMDLDEMLHVDGYAAVLNFVLTSMYKCITKLSYFMPPACWGFATSADKQRSEAFLQGQPVQRSQPLNVATCG